MPHDMVEQVIYGKKLTAHDMETHVDAIAALVEMDPVELWDEAVTTPAMSSAPMPLSATVTLTETVLSSMD